METKNAVAEIDVPAVVEPQRQVGPALPPDRIKAPVTAAQAKIEAIAAVTMSAYSRASMLVLTPEEIKSLQCDFPDAAFQSGAGGKRELIYIQHSWLRDRFNQVFGPGAWSLITRSRWAEPFRTNKGTDGSRVYVEAMLVVRGHYVAEAIGSMDYWPGNEATNYGDAVEGAKSNALRRCAKELGIGLQAWKKEFCDGWWHRNPSGKPKGTTTVDEPPPPQPPVPAEKTPPTPPAAPPAPAKKASPAPKASTGLKAATDKTRLWMLEQLKARPTEPNRELVTRYFEQCAILAPFEELEDIPLHWVPITTPQLKQLIAAIANFEATGDAAKPYPSNLGASDIPAEETKTEAPKPAAADKPEEKLWFMEVICPVPRKGQKRADYMIQPDTIGSLFEKRHGTDDEAQEARQRLWGFVNHYEPKGWAKKDGTQMPPSQTDVAFRKALDAFAEWFEKNHPGEKL